MIFMAVNVANVRLASDTGGRTWISAVAALTTAVALIVLCIEVDENPATRNHLSILLGMIVASFVIEVTYRGVTGRDIHLMRKAKESGKIDKDD